MDVLQGMGVLRGMDAQSRFSANFSLRVMTNAKMDAQSGISRLRVLFCMPYPRLRVLLAMRNLRFAAKRDCACQATLPPF